MTDRKYWEYTKNKQYHTAGTVPKSNRIIVDTNTKWIPPSTNKYTTSIFLGLIDALR